MDLLLSALVKELKKLIKKCVGKTAEWTLAMSFSTGNNGKCNENDCDVRKKVVIDNYDPHQHYYH